MGPSFGENINEGNQAISEAEAIVRNLAADPIKNESSAEDIFRDIEQLFLEAPEKSEILLENKRSEKLALIRRIEGETHTHFWIDLPLGKGSPHLIIVTQSRPFSGEHTKYHLDAHNVHGKLEGNHLKHEYLRFYLYLRNNFEEVPEE